MNRFNEPDEGTPEYNIFYLKKLQDWLSLNPKKSNLVRKEADAVLWAIQQLEGKDNAKS